MQGGTTKNILANILISKLMKEINFNGDITE